MAWVDLSGAFGYGSKLTSTQQQNLRDNIAAMAAGDSGAPAIKGAAISKTSVTVDYQAIANDAVWTPTAGVYMMVSDGALGELELWRIDTWSGTDTVGGLVIMDGSTRRILNNSSGGSLNIFYHTI